ncbi:MAG: hypothetical protein ABEJ48_01625 [Halobacteriales archaeon]
MAIQHTALLTIIKTGNLLLGGLISLYAYRAYRRTGSSPLRALTIGFAIITAGAFLAGIVDQILPLAATNALLIEGLFTALGFGVILYSLHM